jgi:hypothetical protein
VPDLIDLLHIFYFLQLYGRGHEHPVHTKRPHSLWSCDLPNYRATTLRIAIVWLWSRATCAHKVITFPLVVIFLITRCDHLKDCRGCALGKNSKGYFPSSDNRSKGILDLVHSDVCGPMTIASLGGFLYYVIFIDDFSRKTWIFFMKTKDEVFNRFQEFRAQVENLTGKKIKVLRSDNGGEYTSRDFSDFYKEAGIKRELIVPYNPQ